MNPRVLAPTTAHMGWKLQWRGFLFEITVRSRCCVLLLHSWCRKYFSRAPLRNLTHFHHSKNSKYRRTRTHTANIQTLHAHQRSVQHPITTVARVVWSSTSARILQGLAHIRLHHTASRVAAKVINSRHVGVWQHWSAMLSHCTACAQCWEVSVSFCLLSKWVFFCWLARDRLFILVSRRVPIFACWASDCFFLLVASKWLCRFSWSQASVICCLEAGQFFWWSFVHTLWLTGAVVLPLACTSSHSLSRTLILSCSSSHALTHSRARTCWQVSVSFCLLHKRVPRLFFILVVRLVFSVACRQANLFDSHVLSPTKRSLLPW